MAQKSVAKSGSRKRHTKPASKKLPARSPKRALLAHPRHSFKLLPHTHTSYPSLVFLLLLVGLLCGGLSSFAAADNNSYQPFGYTVSAKVAAAALTAPATIIKPTDQTTFSSVPQTIFGDCPINSYVELFRNDVFSGVANCQVDGVWQLTTDLFVGKNVLVAKDFNYTDDQGPSGTPVTVYYNPPATAESSTVSSTNTSNTHRSTAAGPLVLASNFMYQGFYAGQIVDYQFSISGGTGPYAVSINWGDGGTTLLNLKQAGPFIISNRYNLPPGDGHYQITLMAKDSLGQSTLLSIFTIITAPTGSANAKIQLSNALANGQIQDQSMFKGFWHAAVPVYGSSTLAVFSFWLGESREVNVLRRKRQLKDNLIHRNGRR